MRCESVDTNARRISSRLIKVNETMREAKFGSKLEKFEELIKPDTIFYRKIHGAHAESTGANSFFFTYVTFNTECTPRQ